MLEHLGAFAGKIILFQINAHRAFRSGRMSGQARRLQKTTQLAKKGSATVSKGKRMLLFLIQW